MLSWQQRLTVRGRARYMALQWHGEAITSAERGDRLALASPRHPLHSLVELFLYMQNIRSTTLIMIL